MTQCRDWLKTLWPGSYNGVPFYYEEANKKGGRDVEVHEFPNRDFPFVEDLGRKSQYYEGSIYIASEDVDTLGARLDGAFNSKGPGTLVDPDDGPVLVHCQEFTRKWERDKLGFLAYSAKFVVDGAASATISIPFLGRLVIEAADLLAGVAAATFRANVSTIRRPDFVVEAASDGVALAAAGLDAVRLSTQVDPAASAVARDAVEAIVASAPDMLARVEAPDVEVEGLAAAVPDLAGSPVGGPETIAAAVVATARGLAAGMAPAVAQAAFADFVEAHRATFASNYHTPNAVLASTNAAEAARLARLAGLIAWAEAVQRRTYPSRPDGITARAEAAERFEIELNECQGAECAALYVAIETLRARLVEYLTRLIADLAPVVTVAVNAILPSLYWSWRLYADPLRSSELVGRNVVAHPSFMPQEFSALAR